MEASMIDDVELYGVARTVLTSLPTDEEFNKAFDDAEQTRKKTSGKVGELIKELDSRRLSITGNKKFTDYININSRRKEQQAQLSAQRANINALQKCAERRRAELKELTNDLAERTEERDLSKEQISQKRALLDECEKRASALSVGISNMKKEHEELTNYIKVPPLSSDL
uniref:Uncharacterized protein n=1 Tax=Ascaris lumbricoides TaxID=6252 RepID=A0A0M3HVZ6_ASCLU